LWFVDVALKNIGKSGILGRYAEEISGKIEESQQAGVFGRGV
jgi:hypothetical protein